MVTVTPAINPARPRLVTSFFSSFLSMPPLLWVCRRCIFSVQGWRDATPKEHNANHVYLLCCQHHIGKRNSISSNILTAPLFEGASCKKVNFFLRGEDVCCSVRKKHEAI
jgi:hypothetical protein